MPENNGAWGSKLKELREQTSIVQNNFQEILSQHLSTISETEEDGLKGIGVYADLIKFTEGDTTIMGHYEAGRRSPNRVRHLTLLWGLHKINALGLNPLQEANYFLSLNRFEPLNNQECAVILDPSHVPLAVHNPQNIASSPPSDLTEGDLTPRVERSNNQKNRQRASFLPIFVGVLFIVLIAGFLIWPKENVPQAWLRDDFSGSSINTEEWKYSEDTLLYINNGKLVFDLLFDPKQQGHEEDWQEQVLEHKRVDESFDFSRIKFSAALTTPQENSSGSLGVQTHCNGNNQFENNKGILLLYLGGQSRRLTVTYTYDNDKLGEPVDLMGVETGKIYMIDMLWQNNSVDIFVDGEKKTSNPIPCPSPLYFNLNGGVTQEATSLQGFIDEIEVWD